MKRVVFDLEPQVEIAHFGWYMLTNPYRMLRCAVETVGDLVEVPPSSIRDVVESFLGNVFYHERCGWKHEQPEYYEF
jgi:hypothetical protein